MYLYMPSVDYILTLVKTQNIKHNPIILTLLYLLVMNWM